jgi:hypothetical protein
VSLIRPFAGHPITASDNTLCAPSVAPHHGPSSALDIHVAVVAGPPRRGGAPIGSVARSFVKECSEGPRLDIDELSPNDALDLIAVGLSSGSVRVGGKSGAYAVGDLCNRRL